VLQVRLDGFVLLIKLGQVGDDVFHNVGVREGVDFCFLLRVGWNAAQAGESVDTINVHRAATADALSAAPSESQGGINLVLNPDQRIQHHGTGLIQIQSVGLHSWLRGWLIGVPAVDVECLDLCLGIVGGLLDRARLRWRYSGSRGVSGYRCEAAD